MLPKVKHFLASFKKDHKLILVHYLSSDSSSFWVEYKSVTLEDIHMLSCSYPVQD